MSSLVKKVIKEIPKSGSSKKFFHVNPIKNAKSKLSKSINRKARRAQRAVSGNDVALSTYKKNVKKPATQKMTPAAENRRSQARTKGLVNQKVVNHIKKQVAVGVGAKVAGAAVPAAIGGAWYGIEKHRDKKKKEQSNKVKGDK